MPVPMALPSSYKAMHAMLRSFILNIKQPGHVCNDIEWVRLLRFVLCLSFEIDCILSLWRVRERCDILHTQHKFQMSMSVSSWEAVLC